jgi:aspartate kinase
MTIASITPTVTVLKIGGSVLTGADGYARAAEFVSSRVRERFVVVVSAENGHTDALAEEARLASAANAASNHVTPDPALLDLLWSTGELRSVALLSLRLRALGESVTGFSVHEIGLRVASPGIRFNPLAIRAALAVHRVVVVPGFLATNNDRVVTLGRGGSDWSAVLLAASLGAASCELIKDVDGYFTSDPNAANAPEANDANDARLIPRLSHVDALAMADAGCPLVQRQAIEAAAHAHLPLVIRSIHSTGTLLAQ